MKLGDIFLLIFLPILLLFMCGIIAIGLEKAPLLTLSIMTIYGGFILWIFHKRAAHSKSTGKLPLDKSPPLSIPSPQAGESSPRPTSPPPFYEPEKIFRSDYESKKTDFPVGSTTNVTLTVQTPDGFPEGNPSKESAIKVEVEPNKYAVLSFNRPKEHNALAQEVLAAVEYILDEVLPPHDCRAIIFTGTKDVFASGANLKEIFALDKKLAREFALRGQDLMKKIADAKQLTIAAVNGYCFGGALDLALACDKRIASPDAVFCHPGVNLGIITGWGGTQRLPRLIGEAKALEMFLTAKRIGAKEALEIGLIDKIAENPLAESIANYRVDDSSIKL